MVFIIPFVFFNQKKLDKETIKKCFVLLGMGISRILRLVHGSHGLKDMPDVSHFRFGFITVFLTFAFITFVYTLWVALDLIYPERKLPVLNLKNRPNFLVILIIQIIYGGFVAGLNVGLIHNHWPLMSDGQFFHESIKLEQSNLLLSFTEGKSGVQFIHRTFAYVVVGMIIFLFIKSRKFTLDKTQDSGTKTLLVFVFIQFILGVFTLLFHVPLWLGLAHQIMAFFY